MWTVRSNRIYAVVIQSKYAHKSNGTRLLLFFFFLCWSTKIRWWQNWNRIKLKWAHWVDRTSYSNHKRSIVLMCISHRDKKNCELRFISDGYRAHRIETSHTPETRDNQQHKKKTHSRSGKMECCDWEFNWLGCVCVELTVKVFHAVKANVNEVSQHQEIIQ